MTDVAYRVLYRLTFSYKFAKYLSQWTKSHINCTSQHSALNSADLVRRIKDIVPCPCSELFSVDVTGLLPNIPLRETTDYLLRKLKSTGVPLPALKETKDLMSICLSQNYCQLNRLWVMLSKSDPY